MLSSRATCAVCILSRPNPFIQLDVSAEETQVQAPRSRVQKQGPHPGTEQLPKRYATLPPFCVDLWNGEEGPGLILIPKPLQTPQTTPPPPQNSVALCPSVMAANRGPNLPHLGTALPHPLPSLPRPIVGDVFIGFLGRGDRRRAPPFPG